MDKNKQKTNILNNSALRKLLAKHRIRRIEAGSLEKIQKIYSTEIEKFVRNLKQQMEIRGNNILKKEII